MSSGTDWSATSSARTTRTDGGQAPRSFRGADGPDRTRNRALFHGARIAIVPGATNTSVESEVKSRVSELAHVAAADVTGEARMAGCLP